MGITENAPVAQSKNSNLVAVAAAINDLKREFIAECLRIAALKCAHGADNILLGDDINAERDIRLAIENLREASRAFREIEVRQ